MDYELSDAHKLIRDTARRIAREKVAPRAAEMDETGEYPHDIFGVFAEAGLLGLTIPEKYGGSGAGFLALALAVEEVAKHCNSSALILLLSALSTQPINLGGSEEQKQQWLSKSAVGAIKGAFCLTEPNTGSDASNLESRARRDGDDYVIDGEKMYISGGSVADYVCFFAKTGENGSKAIAAFVVPTDSPGYSVPRCDRKMGVIGVPTANIVLQECRVSAANRLGDEGRGFRTAMLTLNTCRPVVGARGLGLAEGCIAYALDYARERKTFGSAAGGPPGDPIHAGGRGDQHRGGASPRVPRGVAGGPGEVRAPARALSIDGEDVRHGDGEPRGVGRHPDPGCAGVYEGPSAGAALPRRASADDRGGDVADPAPRDRAGDDRGGDRVLVRRPL